MSLRLPPSPSAKPTPDSVSGRWGSAQPGPTVPELPTDITALGDQDLMKLFREYVTWENFWALRAVDAEAEEAAADHNHAVAASVAMTTSGKSKVTDARLMRDQDPVVQAKYKLLLQARAERKAAAIVRDNIARASTFVSRELSRRIGREPVNRRVDLRGGG